jgi:HlyD family secretion protein/epimerase transport system membrane fusion protein
MKAPRSLKPAAPHVPAPFAPGGYSLPAGIKAPPSPPVKGLVTAGLSVCLLLFGGFGSWAALAPLNSAAVAPGVVKVDTNRKTVQHLEGGIIADLLVREGDRVRKGQLIARLDALDADADQAALVAQIDALVAREARLVAQRDDKAAIDFPESLMQRKGEPQVSAIISGQQKIFDDQAVALTSQINVWQSREHQLRVQIQSVEEQIVSTEQQKRLIMEELKSARALLSKGYERKPRVLRLERDMAAITGNLSAAEGKIASLEEQIGEAQLQIVTLRTSRARDISEELRDVQTARVEAEERLRKADAKLERREVLAPEDGTVMNLRYFTKGAVVPPGGPILDLVPSQDKLVIEARVQPLDIDVVHPDMPASVRLVAFKQRTTPTLEGRVTRVSADSVIEERSGVAYFTATIEVPASEISRLPQLKLYPGMPASVSIITGERTLLDYIVQPLAENFAHAMRED